MHTKQNDLKSYLENLLAIFKQDLNGVETIEIHSSQFTLQSLKQIALRTPAVLISLLDIKNIQSSPNGREATLGMACFVLVGNAVKGNGETEKLDKNLAILPFVESVLAILDTSEHWTHAEYPENILADNLYSATGVQVAAWSIKWEQTIELGTSQTIFENLNDFLSTGITWQISKELP